MDDDEIEALRTITRVLEPLSDEVRTRVLLWAASRFDVPGIADKKKAPPDTTLKPVDKHQDFADLFYAANPQVNSSRALVASYWLSKEGGDPFQSQSVNALLKDLGYQVSNITDALGQNMKERPALIVQTKKNGPSQQARKLYKITDAGIRRVHALIDANSLREEL